MDTGTIIASVAQIAKLVTLAVLSGCIGGTFDRVPGQDVAEQIVWHVLYGEIDDPPPIEWFHDNNGYLPGASGATGMTLPGWKIQCGIVQTTCPAGLYSAWPFECSLSGSEFAHELMHYRTYLRNGDVDVSHSRGDWGLVDTAFQALIDARL